LALMVNASNPEIATVLFWFFGQYAPAGRKDLSVMNPAHPFSCCHGRAIVLLYTGLRKWQSNCSKKKLEDFLPLMLDQCTGSERGPSGLHTEDHQSQLSIASTAAAPCRPCDKPAFRNGKLLPRLLNAINALRVRSNRIALAIICLLRNPI
jgi:hypothetical protein